MTRDRATRYMVSALLVTYALCGLGWFVVTPEAAIVAAVVATVWILGMLSLLEDV